MIDFSIITVVLNAKKDLQRTLNSVFKQEFKNYELIIIDGGSTDGTLSLIEENKGRISSWVSEPDNGIYDAMNKGIAKASGKYINFLNSGDEYKDELVLKIVKDTTKSDIIYSDTIILDEGRRVLKYHCPGGSISLRSFWKGMVINHQSLFVRRDIVSNYQAKYKIASDFDWTIRLFRRAKTIQYIDIPLVKYYLGGVSDRQIFDSQKETLMIIKKEFGFSFYAIAKVRFAVYNFWRLMK
ncbi:MAG: glycosyltransferase [Chitinophagaceae bacterium]|nr:MAG: glycosyltransferase [Chitinophagaceae bacterium]